MLMLTAAVFDDEYIVLQGVQAMIEWEEFGIELVGTASDGLSALELFRSKRPDMIFTDIRMPGMDGLQLIEEVMREAPETLCIVFSGFNEFDYVKRALQLGVTDYLEKPITIQSIEKAIGKVVERIGKMQSVQHMQHQLEVSRRELLEKATLDLLLIGTEAEAKWRECFGPERAEQVCGITVLAAESGAFSPAGHADYEAVAVRHGQDRLLAYVHFALPTPEFWELQLTEAERAETAAGSGRTYERLSDAPHSYREALRALRSARFLNERGIVRFDDLGERMTSPEGLTEREEAIILSLRSGNQQGLLEQTDRFLEWLQNEKLDAEVAEHELLKLIYLALEEARRLSGDKTGRLPEGYMPHVELREQAGHGATPDWFRAQMERIAEWSMAAREHTKHASVERARTYMEQHCGRDITLQEVAGHVGMNPTYFSVLFKEEIGESYIKYLTRYRIELAKTLLAKGLKVNEVSEKVGYHTYRHFSEVFKKMTGLTPGQYRDGTAPPDADL
ncbi:response regulator [Paenibacillus chartarius]|uniref:Response regulator n=1 Tax=Paenibacillus chartarius TaxID=747481 RepID=A0ABV6DR88_9BACL